MFLKKCSDVVINVINAQRDAYLEPDIQSKTFNKLIIAELDYTSLK